MVLGWLEPVAMDKFLLDPLVSSTNKTDCHDITEILLKVELNTIKQTKIYLTHLNTIHPQMILK
jgi:hypothetical protein